MQMRVNLPPEKVYQYLLRYCKFNKNVDAKHTEPSYILVHAGSYWNREYASSNVEIKIHPERNETRLTFNFSFRGYFLTSLTFGVLALAIIWIGPMTLWSRFQPMIGDQPFPTIGITIISIIVLVYFSIVIPYNVSKTRRRFLDDIRKAFDLLSKTN